jgi:L-serine dehydratase
MISFLSLFKVGIGPSSSHTVGPMKICRSFLVKAEAQEWWDKIDGVEVDIYGSLALTGKGHGTDKAILLGLMGEEPHSVDTDAIPNMISQVEEKNRLKLLGKKSISFSPKTQIHFFRTKTLPLHSNGMKLRALAAGTILWEETYYSYGGGFFMTEAELLESRKAGTSDAVQVPYPFHSAKELLAHCESHGKTIAELMYENEKVLRPGAPIEKDLDTLWHHMKACIEKGCRTEGILPGGLKVRRRAAPLYQELQRTAGDKPVDPLTTLDWVNLYALAVNEENASGGRVVTAPTNGAAGIIPAVIRYYEHFHAEATPQGIHQFLLTATAIGALYLENASISGAEVGCQGEVGVACSMAAGGLVAALGGTMAQVEQAAEIGMEHNLGLTCDPIGGLVQIPCIERNAMAAVKAINAARLALRGDGKHHVSLDSVIKTMWATGQDMKTQYKETSRGGLAVNVTEC